MLDCVLVADRGVAAVRVLRALQRLGVKAVSIHSGVDASALHATLADESVLLGPTLASYADSTQLVEAARQSGAQALHPGACALPGLPDMVVAAGLTWLGDPLQVPVALVVGDGVVEATLATEPVTVAPVASRSAEVVTGLDLTCASLEGEAVGVAPGGVAVSVDLVATTLAPVTAWDAPDLPDVWIDAAVAAGTDPVDPLLAVLTAWGPDRDAAYATARSAYDLLVIEGPVVRRPPALEGVPL